MSKINFNHIINSNLQKYNIFQEKYNKMKINTIIYNKKIHYVSKFKDFLIWNDFSEFLTTYYNNTLISLFFEELLQYQTYFKYPCFVDKSIENIMKLNRKRKKTIITNKFKDKFKLNVEFSNILNSIEKTQSYNSIKANIGNTNISETTIDNIGINDDITISLDLKINKVYDYKEIEKDIDFVKEKNFKNDKIIENLLNSMNENVYIDKNYQTIKTYYSNHQRNKNNNLFNYNYTTIKLSSKDIKKVPTKDKENKKINKKPSFSRNQFSKKMGDLSLNNKQSYSLKIKEIKEFKDTKQEQNLINHSKEGLSKSRRTKSTSHVFIPNNKPIVKKIPFNNYSSQQVLLNNSHTINKLCFNRNKNKPHQIRTKTASNAFYTIKINDECENNNNHTKNLTLNNQMNNKYLKINNSKLYGTKFMKMSNKSLNSMTTNATSITNFQSPKNIKVNNNISNPSFYHNEHDDVVLIKKTLFDEGKKTFNLHINTSFRFSKSKNKDKNLEKNHKNYNINQNTKTNKPKNKNERFSSTRGKKIEYISQRKNDNNNKSKKNIIGLTTGRKSYNNYI